MAKFQKPVRCGTKEAANMGRFAADRQQTVTHGSRNFAATPDAGAKYAAGDKAATLSQPAVTKSPNYVAAHHTEDKLAAAAVGEAVPATATAAQDAASGSHEPVGGQFDGESGGTLGETFPGALLGRGFPSTFFDKIVDCDAKGLIELTGVFLFFL